MATLVRLLREDSRVTAPGDGLYIAPEAFQFVVAAGLRHKHVDDDVAVVQKDPLTIFHPLDAKWPRLVKDGERIFDLFSDSLGLADIGSTGDNKELGDPEDFSDLEDENIGCGLGVRGASRFDRPFL